MVRYSADGARCAGLASRARRHDTALGRGILVVVRPEPLRRRNRLACGRRGRGRRRRGDELLWNRARRHRYASRDPCQRRDRSAVPRPGSLLDARARERGRGCRVGVPADRHVSKRSVVSDLHEPPRLDRPAAAPTVGETPAGGSGRPLCPGTTGAAWRAASARRRESNPAWSRRSAHDRFGAEMDELGGRRRLATAVISSATPSTSTGGTWTRLATTGASALSVGMSSWESQSLGTRSSTASRPGLSRISSPRLPAVRRYGCCSCAPSTRSEGARTRSCFFPRRRGRIAAHCCGRGSSPRARSFVSSASRSTRALESTSARRRGTSRWGLRLLLMTRCQTPIRVKAECRAFSADRSTDSGRLQLAVLAISTIA